MLPPNDVCAQSAKSKYMDADACYRSLSKNPKKQKYRENWLNCIGGFEAVYRHDPDGAWAAAGLFRAGELYLELYGHSYRTADRSEAEDLFRRIVKRYPESRYNAKAKKALAGIDGSEKTGKVKRKSAPQKKDPGTAGYQSAKTCYEKLLNNSRKQQYRDQWFRCIDQFETIPEKHPDSDWAPAGLYMAGELYRALSKKSYLKSDKKISDTRFRQTMKLYPESRYAAKAANALGVKPPKPKPVATVKAEKTTPNAKKKYAAAEACRGGLLKSAKKQKYREHWLRCIGQYKEAYQADPDGNLAPASLYMAGELFDGLSKKSYLKKDKLASVKLLEQAWESFPDTEYGMRAGKAIGAPVKKKEPPKVVSAPTPSKDEIADVIQSGQSAVEKTAGKKAPAVGSMVTVQGLRYWSNPSYTRIVVDADPETTYSHKLLAKDPDIKKPQRLYVDLANSRLGPEIEKFIPINDDLLLDARAGQYSPESVRVVVDIKSFKTYKIFSLRNPFRIVIDVWGESKKTPEEDLPPIAVAKPGEKVAPGALAKQLALGVRRVVIDAGHGGKDYGAPGYLKGVHEKHIVLQLAKRLAKKVREEIGLEVIMTRTTDRYLTLEERTAIANTKNADLFLSIHTNSARNRKAYGIETFFLNLATDEDAILVAARENATSTKNISDLQTILTDLMQNAKINESSRLAGYIQSGMVSHMKRRYSKIKNKGVKQAPFYVLLGAQMPAALIETSFISNPRECRRLVDKNYQEHICDAIVKGIKAYIKEINPSAFVAPAGAQAKNG